VSSPDDAVKSFRLSDGTPALTRPIRPADADALSRGLRRLSPEGHAYRFLHYHKRFTESELRYLTQCDFVDHIALILAILDEDGRELDQVGVARCIRTPADARTAEVAIVVVDEWQQRGGGGRLIAHLARLAWRAGIRRWLAYSLRENHAAPRVLAHAATAVSQRTFSDGLIETTYDLPPSDARPR